MAQLNTSGDELSKSDLMARLDDMKRAIDGYKEYKECKQNNESVKIESKNDLGNGFV